MKILSELFFVFSLLLLINCGSNPEQISPNKPSQAQGPAWKEVDLSKLLVARDESEFSPKGTIGGGASHTKPTYSDKKRKGDTYVLTDGSWIEAYAGTLYHFLLGPHSTFTQFVFGKDSKGQTKISGASLVNPSFEGAFEYHFVKKNPLLKPKSGLGRVIVAAMLLAEIDLKGLASAGSNMGPALHNGEQIYFKIDHDQSFYFNYSHTKNSHDLKHLVSPKTDMPFLKQLMLVGDYELSQGHLDEIKKAAKEFAAIPDSELDKVLDFCEDQLKKLSEYPIGNHLLGFEKGKKYRYPSTSSIEITGEGFEEGVLKKKDGHKTFKSAIKKRFAELRALMK